MRDDAATPAAAAAAGATIWDRIVEVVSGTS